MPKEIPDCPEKKPSPATTEALKFEIELITPMVGGGAEPGRVDPGFPIRPTAIRGHLRYWWRLVVGRTLGSGMWRREEEIFGSAEFPSPVTVSIDPPARINQFDPSDVDFVDPYGPEAYALFSVIENKHLVTKEGAKFTLTMRVAGQGELASRRKAQNKRRREDDREPLPSTITDIEQDVEKALYAWLNFGGIGGRTRRGCGAVHSVRVPSLLPQIPARIFLGPPQKDAIAAWKESLSAYRRFRQTPRGKKHAKTLRNGKTIQVPGRSHWPEADSIRQITGCSLTPPKGTPSGGVLADEDTRDHSIPVAPSELLPSFPRAVLGLPINFHFADGPHKGRAVANLDPKDVQLYPLIPTDAGKLEKADRMASPIITRPLRIGGAEWQPAIIILEETLPDDFRVRLEGKNATPDGHLSCDLFQQKIVDPSLGRLTPMRGHATAIDALIEFISENKYKEWSER